MAERIRVLVIDDHPLFREGLKVILGRDERFVVVAEAGSAAEGLAAAASEPDLTLLDLSLPDMGGLELMPALLRLWPEMPIVVVSMHSRLDSVAAAFQAGAMGYVVKESATDHLLQGLSAVLRGDYYLDSSLSNELAPLLLRRGEARPAFCDEAYNQLTPREQEVLRLLAEGFSPKEAAARLFISPKTVENHRTNLMNKLGVQNSVELVRYAARLGLIELDRPEH